MRRRYIPYGALRAFEASRQRIDPKQLKRYLKGGNESWLAANEAVQRLQELNKPFTFTFFHMPGHHSSERTLATFREEAPAASPDARIDVLERVPSVDEWQRLLRCKNRVPGYLPFLASHPRAVHPTTARQVHEVVAAHPEYMKWPLIVNWETGDVACGKDRFGYKSLLRPLRIVGPDW